MSVESDFEKNIAVLEKKIADLRRHGSSKDGEINALCMQLSTMCAMRNKSLTPWQRVQLSRHPGRPYTLDYISLLFNDFVELAGDRRYSDDKAIVGGFAKFEKQSVMVIGHQKGRDMKANIYRNFGWPNPEGFRKADRLMKLANKAKVPIITFIDTPGAYPGVTSEERHIAESIAVNLREMFSYTVPIIAIVIGEGGSGGALGLGVGNRVLALENSYYSVISPEGCAAILWSDKKFAMNAAQELQLTADKLLEFGIVDEIVPEPIGGAHVDIAATAEMTRQVLRKHLNELLSWPEEDLKKQRYEKFRAIGKFIEETQTEAGPADE